ncbi:hypothetical protein JRQ81_005048 [Phrynocephalus forsythii]|uniref:Protein canopy homolog 3 n=1 Tax=Phrynocephalus forsythii TaxID=171643 RepID=A0A9Q0Y392_9SAUR|nr:hypothetical protein JRQ81_005048 [Phrynocephalus forsythii]
MSFFGAPPPPKSSRPRQSTSSHETDQPPPPPANERWAQKATFPRSLLEELYDFLWAADWLPSDGRGAPFACPLVGARHALGCDWSTVPVVIVTRGADERVPEVPGRWGSRAGGCRSVAAFEAESRRSGGGELEMASWDAVVALLATLLLTPDPGLGGAIAEDSDWVKLPSKCEVCKYVALELKSSFDETGKTKEVIDTKYGFLDGKGSKIKYTKSDIRLIEVVENICKRLLEYNLHKERPGSNRFAKGMSETFETLHNLVHKGVKVVMDIPYELWNETSAEVSDLKKQCEIMVEEYEDVIEDWYRNHQEEDISQFLCANHVLKGKDTSCLAEQWDGKKGDLASSGQKKGKKKEGKGKKTAKTKKSHKAKAEQERETTEASTEEAPAGAEEEEEAVQKPQPLLHSTDEL